MTSQSWLQPEDSSRHIWWHLVVVIVPEVVLTNTSTMYITGNGNGGDGGLNDIVTNAENEDRLVGAVLAVSTHSVTAILFQVGSVSGFQKGVCVRMCWFVWVWKVAGTRVTILSFIQRVLAHTARLMQTPRMKTKMNRLTHTQVPNESIVFPSDPIKKSRSEDAIIAFTWIQFRNDPARPEWIALFPMVKAAVRAMDTMETYCSGKLGQ